MNLNDIENIHRGNTEAAINSCFTEGVDKIRHNQFYDAEPFLERAYSLSLELVLNKSQNETDKSLIDQYETKFADIFSKYTYDLYLQNSKNPTKFIDILSKFKKQNEEIYKELNQKALDSFLADCELFYPKFTSDLNSYFYMTWNPFSYIVQKLETDQTGYKVQTLLIYLKIVKRCCTSLKSSTTNEVSCAIMNNFIKHYQNDLKTHKKKLRTVDETKFKTFVSLLQKFLKGSNLKQLEKFENDVLFDFLMSDFLGKQFYALSRFSSIPTFSKDLVEQFRQRDVINKLLFKSNLHHELIHQFSLFLSKLFNYGFYDDSIIEQLWTKTFEKTDELEDYFKAWPVLQSSIPSKNQKFFWNLVLKKTPSFSSSCIRNFLIQIAPSCNEKDKTEMADLLWKSAIESDSSEEFVDVINEYIPADNEFRNGLKKRCFSLFESNDKKDEDKHLFALNLLIKIWKGLSENETSDDFDFILKNCKLTIENATPFLTLLSTIASDFTHPFTDEELELIKKQIIEIISANSMLVFNFIQRLFGIQKGHLFTPHLLFSLLEWMTKLETVDSVIFKLIRSLYEMIYSSTKVHKKKKDSKASNDINYTNEYLNKAVESLWNLLYRSNIPNVADFLVKIHLKKIFNGLKKKKNNSKIKKKKRRNGKSSKSKEKRTSNDSDSESDDTNDNNDNEKAMKIINEFIDKCFQKLDCFGSLTALYFLILEIEDSLNLNHYNIQRNVFNGYKQTLTILLTKDYTGEISIPVGTSYYTFRKLVRDKVKVSDSQIALMSGQTKLDQNHVFRNNEKIKVFFNTFDEGKNNNKTETEQAQNDSDSESESDSYSQSSSSSFSLDVNSFDIEWEKENLPSQILNKYRKKIKELLDNKDTMICEASLNLLNLLSIDENEVKLLRTKSDLFDVKHPFLFIYRLNLLANLVYNKDIDVLNNIYNSDLYSQLMNIVFKMDRNTFTKDEYFDLLLETVVDINKIGSDIKELKKLKRSRMRELLNDSDSSLTLIMNWVIEEEKMKPVNTLRVIDFLVILADYIQIDKKLLLDHQMFPEFFDLTLFNENQSIRIDFYNLLTYFKTSRIQDFFLSRLNSSRKRNCIEYFQLLKRIAKFSSSYENCKFLFDTLVDSLNDNLFIYNDVKVKTNDQSLIDATRDLCADLACPDFIKGIVDDLEFIFPSVYNRKQNSEEEEKIEEDEKEIIKKPELLLHVLVDKIVFNTNRYVYSPPSLFNLVKRILNRFPSLFPPLIQSLIKFNDSIQNVKNQYLNLYSPDKKYEKGLNNLGCTCYLNASIQQLFHIKEIRNAIFSYDPTNDIEEQQQNEGDNELNISKNWLCQLQLLMANLKYAPLASIDASGFVKNWKMYGNEPIDPNEQQDAIEFLQILLDRLDERIPEKPISKCVRGQIIHTIKQINGNFQSQSYEDFITFTLEVINKKNFSDSFDAFLEPDIFDGDNKYNVEEIGQIDATRYHAIKKAPEILIFQLKRFDFDLSSLTRKKINSAYQIDLDVDISRLLWNKDSNNNSSCMYELFGIIEHSGNAEGGHYISFIKSNEIHNADTNQSSSSVWRVYNDSRVNVTDEKEVIKSATGGAYTRHFYDPVTQTVKTFQSTKIDSAYILFYRKKRNEKNEHNKNEIEIEEEEEDKDDNQNDAATKDLDEPIQFMPEIMLREFFKNMKKLILRHVLFSNEYINFMDYISKVDNFDTFSFIYQYTMKSIISTGNQFKSMSIIQTAMKKASTDINFARYILKKENNLIINTLLNFTEEKQASTCCSLADSAISVIINANKEEHKYNEDIEFIEAIINCKDELVSNTDKFDYIFRPFYFYLVLKNSSFEYSKKYMEFFLDILESIQTNEKENSLVNQKENFKKYQSQYFTSNNDSNESNIGIKEMQNISFINESTKINLHSRIDFKSINMLHVFKSMVFLIEQNDFESNDQNFFNSMKKRVINHEFLDTWSQSRYHTNSFNCFVIHLLKDDEKMTKKYFHFICKSNHVEQNEINESEQNESNENESNENNESSEKSGTELKSKGKVKFKLSKSKTKSKSKSKLKSGHIDHHDHIHKSSSRKDYQKMTIQTLSAIFVNLLTFKDSLTNFRINWFLTFTEKLKWSQHEIGNFLRESSTNIKDHCKESDLLSNFTKEKSKSLSQQLLIINPSPLFESTPPYIFTKYLLSQDHFIRSACISFIYSMFPSYQKLKIANGQILTEKVNTTNSSTVTANYLLDDNNNNNMNIVQFRKESDKITSNNNNNNRNNSDDESNDSDASADLSRKSDDNDKDVNVDNNNDDGDDQQKVVELQTLIKIFNILMNMMKSVASTSKEIASTIESYHGSKAIPTDSFFELLSWSSVHLIDCSNKLKGETKIKSQLESNEIQFLTDFDLSKYSSQFSSLITKFSSFKNNVRCCVIDLLRYIFIIFIKNKENEETNKRNVLIEPSNSIVYLNALSKLPSSFETTSFIDNATLYFIPIITPFAEKIESHILKNKFIEMSLKSSLNTKSYTASTNFINNHKRDEDSNTSDEENYYNNGNLSNITNISNNNIGNVITQFVDKLKCSERLCTLLWKKRKSTTWGKSSLLLKITSNMMRNKGWPACHFFSEFNCILIIIEEFMNQHEIQQLNFYTWELMLDIFHSYNRCYIMKQTNSCEDGNELEESDVMSSEQSNRKGKNTNSKSSSHNFLKKFNKNFIELWKTNLKVLSAINSYLKRATVNYSLAALKVLCDVFLCGASFSPEISQFGLKMISSESENFYQSLKSDEIREKYAKLEVQIVRNSCSSGRKAKKSSKSKDNEECEVNSDVIERDSQRLLTSEIFNVPLFKIFLNEIENDEVKSKLYINFLSTFNDITQIDEQFATEAIEFLKKNGHQNKKNEEIEKKAIMTKKEKKKLDALNKEATNKNVERIVRNINSLIEKELLKITKYINAEDAAAILPRLSLTEKVVSLLNSELNARFKFIALKKADVDKSLDDLNDKRPRKEIYDQLGQVVDKIISNNVNKK